MTEIYSKEINKNTQAQTFSHLHDILRDTKNGKASHVHQADDEISNKSPKSKICNSELHVSPRGPSQCTIDDLIILKKQMQEQGKEDFEVQKASRTESKAPITENKKKYRSEKRRRLHPSTKEEEHEEEST